MLRSIRAALIGLALLVSTPAGALDLLLDIRVDEAIAAGNPDLAVTELKAALPTATDEQSEAAVRERLANLLTTLGRHTEAAEEYEALATLRAAQLGPEAPEVAAAWQQAASAWNAGGDTAKAINAWTNALKIDAANGIVPETNPILVDAEAALASIASPRERSRLEIGLRSVTEQNASVGTASVPSATKATGWSRSTMPPTAHEPTTRAPATSIAPSVVRSTMARRWSASPSCMRPVRSKPHRSSASTSSRTPTVT